MPRIILPWVRGSVEIGGKASKNSRKSEEKEPKKEPDEKPEAQETESKPATRKRPAGLRNRSK